MHLVGFTIETITEVHWLPKSYGFSLRNFLHILEPVIWKKLVEYFENLWATALGVVTTLSVTGARWRCVKAISNGCRPRHHDDFAYTALLQCL
jgi:hypothetical protein